MLDQMNTGPISQVRSVELMKIDRYRMRTMLATHTLACTGLAGSMVDVLWGAEGDVQNTHRHDSADGQFLLHTHLQLDDPRKGDD